MDNICVFILTMTCESSIMLSFEKSNQLGKEGKEGITFSGRVLKTFSDTVFDVPVKLRRGTQIAVKTFKARKSGNRIEKEARLQQTCASKGVSPMVYQIDKVNKHIAMECMDSTPVVTYRNKKLPDDLQYQICALMHRMDEVKILHNDMNAHNVMCKNGRVYMIDFGLARVIKPKDLKKYGDSPNVNVTLWGLVRGFKRYGVETNILKECLEADDKSSFFERGEQALRRRGTKRKRKR